jgi:hypothetical protein
MDHAPEQDKGADWHASWTQLQALSDEEVMRRHDKLVGKNFAASPDYWLRELARRDAQRQADRMLCLTRVVTVLTVVNVVAVILELTIG